MRKVPINTYLLRPVFFDIGEGNTYPGAREKFEGILPGSTNIGYLPFLRQDTFIPPVLMRSFRLRHIALYMRY